MGWEEAEEGETGDGAEGGWNEGGVNVVGDAGTTNACECRVNKARVSEAGK